MILSVSHNYKGPSTLATLFNHMWPRIVAGIFILHVPRETWSADSNKLAVKSPVLLTSRDFALAEAWCFGNLPMVRVRTAVDRGLGLTEANSSFFFKYISSNMRISSFEIALLSTNILADLITSFFPCLIFLRSENDGR